jgi:Arc/MetJ-type ribon-helix-helix transcriptional regulator
MITIPVQVNEIDVKKIDSLVRLGRFKNRNQAIKSMLQERLAYETLTLDVEDVDEENRRQKLIQEWSQKQVRIKFTIRTNQDAPELIGEDRER